MSSNISSLDGRPSLKALTAANLTKNQKKVDPKNTIPEISKYLTKMEEHTQEIKNAKGESKRLIVLEKKNSNIDENEIDQINENEFDQEIIVDDYLSFAAPTIPYETPLIEPRSYFQKIASIFRRNAGNDNSTIVISSEKEEDEYNQDDNLRSFANLPKMEEKDVIDIVNLSLKDRTMRKDFETLSNLLRLSAKDGHANLVGSILDEMLVQGFSLNEVDSEEMSALGYAILNKKKVEDNNLEIDEQLLNAGADPNLTCRVDLYKIIVPLIRNNNYKLIKDLVSFVKKPLEKYCKDNSKKIKEAFDFYKDSIIKANENKFNSLNISIDELITTIENDIQNGSLHIDLLIEAVFFFLEKIIDDLPFPNKIPMSPFMLAVLNGDIKSAQRLVEKKADITSCPVPTTSTEEILLVPIHLASLLGSVPMVRVLLDNGVDINSKGLFGMTPLMVAILRGETDLVEFLLKSGASVDSILDVNLHEGFSLLKCNAMYLAQILDKQKMIKMLTNHGAKIEDAFIDDTSKVIALFVSAVLGDEEKFNHLLNNGIDINTQGVKGLNVFYLMSVVCSYMSNSLDKSQMQELIVPILNKIISKILNESKDLSPKMIKQIVSTILIIGISDYSEDLINLETDFFKKRMQFLLDKGADTFIMNSFMGSNLGAAFQMGNLKLAKMLLDEGHDPNIANDEGVTPLMNVAAITIDLDMLETLLRAENIDLNLCDLVGRTALRHAIQSCLYKEDEQEREKSKKIILTLLKSGADPNIADLQGITPLMEAVQRGDNELIEMLLSNKADPNIADQQGITSLMIAAQRGDNEVIEILLAHGADPDLLDQSGNNPLMMAMIGKIEKEGPFHYKIYISDDSVDRRASIKTLAERTKNINVKDFEKGNTALIETLLLEDDESAKILLEKGANPNISNDDNFSPLYLAAGKGNLVMVEILLEKSADPNLKSAMGYTALDIARSMGNTPIVKTLLENGANNYRALSIIRSKRNNFAKSHPYITRTIETASVAGIVASVAFCLVEQYSFS